MSAGEVVVRVKKMLRVMLVNSNSTSDELLYASVTKSSYFPWKHKALTLENDSLQNIKFKNMAS